MKTIKIAIAGLGVVGQEVFRYLASNKETLAQKHGISFEIVGVSSRDRGKAASLFDLSDYKWYDSPVKMLETHYPDIVVELIGGSEGVAYNVAYTAIAKKAHLVTANKALLAVHGNDLARDAEKAGITIAYEAAVCAEIPIIKELRQERQDGTNITMIQGILNGTCNFILSQMAQHNMPFDDALRLAQELGYAEQDPSFDIDGIDSAHKLALLASLVFGIKVDVDNIDPVGIRDICYDEVQAAQKSGKPIKLIAHAEKVGDQIVRTVLPSQLAANDPFLNVNDIENAIIYRIDKDKLKIIKEPPKGQGAGGEATRKSVINDIVDIACGNRYPLFAVPYSELK